PQGYTVGYTLCIDTTSCHGNTPVSSDTARVSVPANGYADLWWHFTPVVQNADLTISKTGPSVIHPGDQVQYTVTVTNNGPATVGDFTVTDMLPAGFTYTNYYSDFFGCPQTSSTSVTCTGRNLASGQSRSFNISLIAPNVSSNNDSFCTSKIVNTATVSSANDNNSQNNSTRFESQANCPVTTTTLIPTKLAPATVRQTDVLDYTLQIRNSSSVAAQNVEVSDTFPYGLIYIAQSQPNGFTCDITAGKITCRGASIAANSSVELHLKFTVPVSVGCNTKLLNDFSVRADNAALATSPKVETVVQCEQQTGCIEVLKETLTPQNTFITPVTQFTFKLDNNQSTVNNNQGYARFDGVSVGQHTVSEVSANGWENIATTPQNGLVNVQAGNQCAVANFKNRQVLPQQGQPALKLDKSGPSTAAQGQEITYTLSVSNTGTAAANGVTVTDSIPSGLDYVRAPGCTNMGNLISCTANTLAPYGGHQEFNLTFKVKQDYACNAFIKNTAKANINNSNYVTSPEVTTTVQCQQQGQPSLTVEKSVVPSYVATTPGSALAYTVTVRNTGTAVANNVVVTDQLADGLEFQGGDCTANGQLVTCQAGSLAPGGFKSFTIQTKVRTTSACTPTILNTAKASASGVNEVSSTQVPAAITCPQDQPSFTITKTDNRTTAQAGDVLTYDIRVKNTSNVNAQSVTVQDFLPSQLEFISASDSPNRNGSNISWTFPLNAQTEKPLSIQARVIGYGLSNGTVIVNTATITNGPSATDSTTVQIQQQQGGLAITKSGPSTVNQNGTYAYTVTVQNTSTTTAVNNVKVTDTLSPSLTFLGYGNSCYLLNGVVNCDIGTLNPGATSQPITINVQVKSDAPCTPILNTAYANGTNVSQATSTQISTQLQCQQSGQNFSISIIDSPDPIRPAQTLNYTLQVTNNTDSNQTATVTQILPGRVDFTYASDNGRNNGSTITWDNQFFTPRQTKNYNVTVYTHSDLVNNDTLQTTAYVANAQARETTRVIADNYKANRDLTLSITDTPDPVRPCNELTYRLSIRNNGNDDRTVTVRANLDQKTRFASASDGGNDRSSSVVEWNNIRVYRNNTKDLELRVNVDCSARNGDSLYLSATADEASDSERTQVQDNSTPQTNNNNGILTFQKRANLSTAQPGDTVVYTITITNGTNNTITNAMVNDSFNSSQINMQNVGLGQLNGSQLTWNLGTLNAGDTRTLTYSGQLGRNLRHGDVVINNAVLTSSQGVLNSSATVQIIQYLPQTGSSFTNDMNDGSQFLQATGTSASTSVPVTATASVLLSMAGVAGYFGRRIFI
ncbi:MAG: hypothetical protein JWM56_145, partial [Candidatus Peribacteria bacterium]|nr:hypothetical protein [Candidatus Peribacteria bacterium]